MDLATAILRLPRAEKAGREYSVGTEGDTEDGPIFLRLSLRDRDEARDVLRALLFDAADANQPEHT